MKQLNIVRFQTEKDNQYIYDPCSNRVYYTPNPIIDIIENYYKHTKNEFINQYNGQYLESIISKCYNRVTNGLNLMVHFI